MANLRIMGYNDVKKTHQSSDWVTQHLLKQTPLDFIESRSNATHSKMGKLANLANGRKKKASHGPRLRKAASKRISSACEARTVGDTIHGAAGCAVHEDAVRRGGLEASEGCRDRSFLGAGQNPCARSRSGNEKKDAMRT